MWSHAAPAGPADPAELPPGDRVRHLPAHRLVAESVARPEGHQPIGGPRENPIVDWANASTCRGRPGEAERVGDEFGEVGITRPGHRHGSPDCEGATLHIYRDAIEDL